MKNARHFVVFRTPKASELVQNETQSACDLKNVVQTVLVRDGGRAGSSSKTSKAQPTNVKTCSPLLQTTVEGSLFVVVDLGCASVEFGRRFRVSTK